MALNIIEQLLKLQEKDRRLKLLRTEAGEIPLRKSKISSRLEHQRQVVAAAQEKNHRHQTEIKEVEQDVELSREKINRYKKQQMEVKDNESYRALDNEIRGLTRHILRQEDSQIGVMEAQEKSAAELAAQQEILDGQIKEVAAEEAALDEKLEKLDANLKTVEAERDALTEGVDPQWLSRYTRTFDHVGDFALVTSNNATCAGCHMKIPPALVLKSKSLEKITTCNFCGRMLYFEI